jgi:Tfp pilus assembly protein PilV
MPRLIALVVLIVAFLGIAAIVKRAKRSAEQRKDTYRPSTNGQSGDSKTNSNSSQDASGKSFKKPDDDSVVSMISKTEAKSLRDALTGGPIDINKKTWQCSRCQSLYHDESIEALQHEHQGKCIQCGSTGKHAVTFTDFN